MTQALPEGTVTVLFTDVEGSTALTAQQGDEAARALLRAQGELVREQVKAHSGHEVKSMGDGFMVAFGSARRALDCAVDIQRALEEHNRSRAPEHQVMVRMGLNSGEVIREEDDLFGSTVNAAARVAAKANGGQILVPEAVKALMGAATDVRFADRGRFRLKGFPERWRLYEVVWQEEPAAAPPTLVERTPYVGREAERAELSRLLENAFGGHGGLVLIGGEPGVGKTRLAEELMAEAGQRNMTALIGRCYEMEGAPPYIPFVEMLEAAARMFPAEALRTALGDSAPEVAKLMPELHRMFPDIPPPPEMPPEQQRRYLFNGMREFIARAGSAQPLLLVLDDLHWADDSTLLLLQHIAQQLSAMPVLVVGTYRDVELDVARPLARAQRELLRQRLARDMPIKRLAEDGVAAMLRALSGEQPPASLVEAVYSETEGNPFFVEEVFKHLADEGKLFDARGRWRTDLSIGELEVPRGVRLVIGQRLERVSEECRRVLTTAAVIGRAFSFELLEALTEVGVDELLDAVDEAERAHLITAASEGPEARFIFAHELIRQTLVSGLSLPRRQRLHLRVGEAMNRLYAGALDEHASDLAHHLYQAGAAADPRQTARFLMTAGERAYDSAAFEDALRQYEAALAVQPPDDRRAGADLLARLGMARRSLGRWDDALSVWHEALEIYDELGDTAAMVQVHVDIGTQLLWSARYLDALENGVRCLLKLGGQVSPERATLLGGTGVTLSVAGYYRAADAMIERAMAMAEHLGDERALGAVLTVKTVHHWGYMQYPQAVDSGLRAADLLRSTGDLWNLAGTLFFVLNSLLFLARYDEADRVREELAPLAERLGYLAVSGVGGTAFLDMMRTGNIDSWEAAAKEGLERARGLGLGYTVNSYILLGVVDFWRGRWPEALEKFEEAEKADPGGVFSGFGPAFLFLTKAYGGDRAGALAVLEAKGRAAGPQPTTRQRLSLALRTVRAARASGVGLPVLRSVMRGTRPAAMPFPRPKQPNSLGAWLVLETAVEGLAVLGERSRSARLYPLVLEAMATGNLFRGFDIRLVDTIAGIAAACGGEWHKAEEHYLSAIRRAEEIPHKLEQPDVRRWYARMLLDRAGPGDREKARELLTEAVEMYRQIGMPKHLELADQLLAQT